MDWAALRDVLLVGGQGAGTLPSCMGGMSVHLPRQSLVPTAVASVTGCPCYTYCIPTLATQLA